MSLAVCNAQLLIDMIIDLDEGIYTYSAPFWILIQCKIFGDQCRGLLVYDTV